MPLGRGYERLVGVSVGLVANWLPLAFSLYLPSPSPSPSPPPLHLSLSPPLALSPTPQSATLGSSEKGRGRWGEASERTLFRAWHLYFGNKEYHPNDEFVSIIIRMTAFFRQRPELLDAAVKYDFGMAALRYERVQESIAGDVALFKRLFEECPSTVLDCLGVALCEIYYGKVGNEQIPIIPIKLQVRLIGHLPITPFRDLKACLIGKYLTVQGHIVRVSSIKPFAKKINFTCAKCLRMTLVELQDGKFQRPIECSTRHCNSKIFSPDRTSKETLYVNWQSIKLQEIPDFDAVYDEGRIPRIVECELTCDLVDAVVPGERVLVSGILKTIDSTEGRPGSSGTSTSSIFINVNNVQKLKSLDGTLGENCSPSTANTHGVDQAPCHLLQEVIKLSQCKNVLQALVKSFCPRIYGNELVKFGLLLGIFGGSRRGEGTIGTKGTGNVGTHGQLLIRTDPHVLIVGDPGLGKSQLLSFAAAIAPRAVFVCANTSTAAGLTATVQDGALEAGAMVLADQGCCCIDEFDKIAGEGWRALLDVMEQQTVNIAKAGVVCTLPARTSVLAAANPVGGHYSRQKSLLDNLKMDASLLSRFDLVFILLDRPNPELDRVLSEHVLGNLKKAEENSNASYDISLPVPQRQLSQISLLHSSQHTSTPRPSSTIATAKASLKRRLEDGVQDVKLIEPNLLRLYITHARQRIAPRMTEEAANCLQEFYLELRENCRKEGDDMLPITTRHLESLIRLAEARAKLELRPFVTADDAQDIIELVHYCFYGSRSEGDPTTHTVSTSATIPAAGSRRPPRKGSKLANAKSYVSELVKISARTGEDEFSEQQLKQIYDVMQFQASLSFNDLLASLNENGYLLMRAGGRFKLLIT